MLILSFFIFMSTYLEFFAINLQEFLIHFEQEPLFEYMVCKYFLPLYRLSPHSADCFFCVQNLFGLMQLYLSIFAFVACACGVISRKSWPKLMSGRFSFYFLFFFPLAMLHDMWDLRSLTRGRTHAPCSRSTGSEPLDHQGSPPLYFLLVVSQFQVLGLNLPFILSLFFF